MNAFNEHTNKEHFSSQIENMKLKCCKIRLPAKGEPVPIIRFDKMARRKTTRQPTIGGILQKRN